MSETKLKHCPFCGAGYALLTFATDFKYEINLITKEYC